MTTLLSRERALPPSLSSFSVNLSDPVLQDFSRRKETT